METVYEQPLPQQHGVAESDPIATVTAQTDRTYPVMLTFGPRARVLLTAREAAALARSLVDAVKSLTDVE